LEVSTRTIRYKSVGACSISADLHRPLDPRGPTPLIVWLHGGALIGGSRTELPAHQRDAYLAAGLSILAVDYRLAPETRLPRILGDVCDAYDWAATAAWRELDVDPERVGVVGHSAGGYLALSIAQRVRPRPRAVVAFYGFGDILGDWSTQPSTFYNRQGPIGEDEARAGVGGPETSNATGEERWRFYRWCRQQGAWPREVTGLDPVAERRELLSYCPVNGVTSSHPPTMLLHGDSDEDVPIAQSATMAAALEAAGVESEFVRLAGLGHGFDGDPTADGTAEAMGRVAAFLGGKLA
jgi:acetyl esterase/lipase